MSSSIHQPGWALALGKDIRHCWGDTSWTSRGAGRPWSGAGNGSAEHTIRGSLKGQLSTSDAFMFLHSTSSTHTLGRAVRAELVFFYFLSAGTEANTAISTSFHREEQRGRAFWNGTQPYPAGNISLLISGLVHNLDTTGFYKMTN